MTGSLVSMGDSVRRLWVILFFVVSIQSALFSLAYGFSSLFGPEIPWHVDHLYHLYQISRSVEFWKAGALTGYDPTFAAGYIGGATFNWSAKAPTFIAWVGAPWLEPEVSYKAYIAASVISAPLLLSAAMYVLGGRAGEILAAGLIGIFLWWATYLSWYVTAGMVAYVWSAYLAAFVASLIWRICAQPIRILGLASVSVLTSAAWWVHPHFPLLLLFFTLPLVLFVEASKFRRALLVGGALVLIASATNIPWFMAMTGGGAASGEGTLALYGYQREIAPIRIIREAVGQFGDGPAGAKLNPALLGGTIIALVLCRGERRKFAIAFTLSWGASQLYAYLGGAVEAIARTQPNRIAPAGYLLLALPAVWGFSELVNRALTINRFRLQHSLGAAALLTVAFSIPALETVREAIPGSWGRYGLPPPHFRDTTPLFDWLVEVIETKRPSGGRVLFEQSAARVFDGTHIVGLIAMRTSAEFIGGPYASDNLVNFKDGRFLGRQIRDYSDVELEGLLERYAIELIVVHSEESRMRIEHLPGVHFVGKRGPALAYQRALQTGYFQVGSGEVADRRPGRLMLEKLQGEDVVLKYHFFDSLRAIPSATIDAEISGKLPPFIRLTNPPLSVELTSFP